MKMQLSRWFSLALAFVVVSSVGLQAPALLDDSYAVYPADGRDDDDFCEQFEDDETSCNQYPECEWEAEDDDDAEPGEGDCEETDDDDDDDDDEDEEDDDEDDEEEELSLIHI